MKIKSFTLALLCGGLTFLTVSCDKEDANSLMSPTQNLSATSSSSLTTLPNNLKIDDSKIAKEMFDCSYEALSGRLPDMYGSKVVAPSACGPTAFHSAITPHVSQFSAADWGWYNHLSLLNQLYTYVDNSKQYFGARGELTDFAARHKRNLEKFWQMPNAITLKGQHTNTLQNRDAIAAVYLYFTTSTPTVAYANADYIIANAITPSQAFKKSPLLSFDGFATSSDMIVIGDGIVQVLNESGVDKEVTFAGILAHEWGHQTQFDNIKKWYGAWEYSPEATRRTELEADFLASYYMTHKRGATYNWKRSAEFFELFFNIGDCSFSSSSHHGTPLQRLAASRIGWIIAQETKPMGHILSADDLHALFTATLNSVIDNKIDSSEALARLKNAQQRAVYGNVMKHKQELKAIVSGKIDKSQVKNL